MDDGKRKMDDVNEKMVDEKCLMHDGLGN